jgi:hypothetical protein
MMKSFVRYLLPALPLLGSTAFFADEFTQANKALNGALAAGNEAALKDAANKIVSDNSPRAVELLCKSLAQANLSQYWILISTLSQLSSNAALASLATHITSSKQGDLRRDLIMALRHCKAPSATEQLLTLLKHGTKDIQVSCTDELVDRGAQSAIPILIELAEKDVIGDRELSRRCFKAIRALTNEEPPGTPATWRSWWDKKTQDPKGDSEQPLPRTVGDTVVDSVRRTRITDFEDLKKGKEADILVVQGASDSVQDVLVRLDIKHTVLSNDRLGTSEGISLAGCFALFVNCGTADWPPKQAERVRQFVENGGYLFVTDIGMLQLVKHAFPGILDFGKGSLNDMKVEIVPAKGSTGHPLLRGVELPTLTTPADKATSSRMQWTIDAGGPAISFDPRRASALIDAPELLKKRKPSTVAFTFVLHSDQQLLQQELMNGGLYEEFSDIKGGRVVCVLSHFAKQRDKEDGFILQNLLINFLIEGKDRSFQREARMNIKAPKK